MADEIDWELIKRVREAFGTLPPNHREIILLARVEGLTFPEMGIRLGLAPCEVERRLALAFDALSRAVERQQRPWWRFW